MPFVQRVIEPKYLSKTALHDENGKPLVTDWELETVANSTLSNALRQLASLVLVANDIFVDLTKQLENVSERSRSLQTRIATVEDKVSRFDPKKVTVPEGDMSGFSLLRDHFAAQHVLQTGLFSAETRPEAVRALYAAATTTPVPAMRQLDRCRRDGHRSSRFFLCTPVLGAKRRKIRSRVDIDIETRMPAAVEELRRWTSDEALGDITVPPDCITRITASTTLTNGDVDLTDAGATSGDEGIDHKLPSPEEQVIAVANKFPAEIVAVDVSQKRFDRMCSQRRSLLHVDVPGRGTTANSTETAQDATTTNDSIRRRSRTRKPRAKRRNTIAGTDQKEIQEAIFAGEQPSTSAEAGSVASGSGAVIRSKSSDLLRTKKESPPDGKKSHFNTLKQWGKNRLKMINKSFESRASDSSSKIEDIDDVNIYETITMRRKKSVDKKESSRSTYVSADKNMSLLPISTPMSGAMSMAVKLRESAVQRRQRRNGVNKDEPHSSSGNWSASSESGRTSIGSELTTSTTQPKSTTSCATSNNSLNTHSVVLPSSVASRRRFVNTSNSGSVTSEGTLTPDIIHDLHDDDGESSVYSCDTEGYYTSFHMDSGLKTLKEEDASMPSTPLQVTSAFNNSGSCNVMTAENEYELFGKGSTSTTTSSAGTVCTTLMAAGSQRSLVIGPAVPERKSSLSKLDPSESKSRSTSLDRNYNNIEHTGTIKRNLSASGNKATVVALVHKQSKGDVSPDSGHNTSSSPIESINSPNGQRSCSEFEFSESSDLEGVDRIERIRIKTTINSSRIPSMCVITPPHSDDESVKSMQRFEIPKRKISPKIKTPSEHSTESEQEEKHSTVVKRASRTLHETDLDADNKPDHSGSKKMQIKDINPISGYATIETVDGTEKTSTKTSPSQPLLKSTFQPFNNMIGKLRSNISNLTHRKDAMKTPPKDTPNNEPDLYDSGEYVTIADVRNNNKKSTSSGVYYSNDVVKRNLATVLSGQIKDKDTEYVSLNELPSKLDSPEAASADSLERRRRQGARVTLDAEGKVVYSSDSLKRRKGAHTTFEPGPCVKDVTTPTASPLPSHRTPKVVRPIGGMQDNKRSLSPQLNKLVIRANSKSSSGQTADVVRMPPSTIVTPAPTPATPKSPPARGAYVNMQDPRSFEEGQPHLNSKYPPTEVVDVINSPYIEQHFPQYSTYDRNHPMYRTLPAKRAPMMFQEDPQRSVTPDITRGLHAPPQIPYQHDPGPKNEQYYYLPNPPLQRQFSSSTPSKQNPPVISKIPLGISNFFSPIHSRTKPEPLSTSHSPKISPIDPRNTGTFQSSTPSSKPSDFPAAANLTSRLIPPKKSTMSYDELYTVIHKSKKKFNIGEDPGRASPALPDPISPPQSTRDRHSWSPNNKDTTQLANILNRPKEPGSRQSWAVADRKIPPPKTSTMDFKRLLLQHGSKQSPLVNSGTKLSAVEQLKLTKPVQNAPPINILDLSSSPRSLTNRKLAGSPGSPRHAGDKQRVVPKLLLSPRSAWRFPSPRSDVLSSTILEDCREDESPNSSLEKEKGRPATAIGAQGGVAASNRNVPTAECGPGSGSTGVGVRRQIQMFSGRTDPSSPNAGMTRAQFIQAQKAQFLMNANKPENIPKCPSPPALETAL